MEFNLHEMATFGIAGNFTGHLEQAGEAVDFANIKTTEESAPKAIFPTYIPSENSPIPKFLSTFPFDSTKIIYPKNETKIQLEPECAIIFDATWENSKITKLNPIAFGASNDCSIRKTGAKKISEKKNWGNCSKGLSSNLIPIDSFSKNGIINNYRIASFMIRNNEIYEYGEDSAVRDYSYIYEKLITWIIEKLNFQQDEGPQENIYSYLNAAGNPSKIMISIGATRYTEFGEKNYLQKGDKSYIIIYPKKKYSKESLIKKIKNDEAFEKEISALIQEVIL